MLIFQTSQGSAARGAAPPPVPGAATEPVFFVEEHLSRAAVNLDLRWAAVIVKSSPRVGTFFLAFNIKKPPKHAVIQQRWHILIMAGRLKLHRKKNEPLCTESRRSVIAVCPWPQVRRQPSAAHPFRITPDMLILKNGKKKYSSLLEAGGEAW